MHLREHVDVEFLDDDTTKGMHYIDESCEDEHHANGMYAYEYADDVCCYEDNERLSIFIVMRK